MQQSTKRTAGSNFTFPAINTTGGRWCAGLWVHVLFPGHALMQMLTNHLPVVFKQVLMRTAPESIYALWDLASDALIWLINLRQFAKTVNAMSYKQNFLYDCQRPGVAVTPNIPHMPMPNAQFWNVWSQPLISNWFLLSITELKQATSKHMLLRIAGAGLWSFVFEALCWRML